MHPGPNPYPNPHPNPPPPEPQPEPQPEPPPEPPPLTRDQWVFEPNPTDDDIRSDDPSQDCDLVHATPCYP